MKSRFVLLKTVFVLFSCTLLLAVCKKKQTDTPLVIGNEYQGGYIFYLDNTGKHGMVAKKTSYPNIPNGWGCFYTDIPTSTLFGTGKANTNAILNACSDTANAARVCDKLSSGGFDDWYLPSKEELQLIYTNLHQHSLGSFENHSYWSSSEHSQGYGWEIDFTTGLSDRGNKANHYQLVIAVRDF